MGNRYSYWRDLLERQDKAFGEKIARRIEESLHLPRYWLDRAGEPIPLNVQSPDGSYLTPHWIFTPALFAACASLDDTSVAKLERVMRAHLGLPVDDS